MPIENLEGVLAAHPFFGGLERRHLETVVGCASNVTVPAGEFMFREGTPADRFFLLRHGQVGVEVFVPGSGAQRLETLGEGEVLGWSWLFPPYKTHFDARALTLVRALALDGACLRAKCESDPMLGYELLRRFAPVLIQRLDAARMQLLDVYANRP